MFAYTEKSFSSAHHFVHFRSILSKYGISPNGELELNDLKQILCLPFASLQPVVNFYSEPGTIEELFISAIYLFISTVTQAAAGWAV